MDLLIATNNAHKVQELRDIFALNQQDVNLLVPAQLGLALDPVEDAETYLGNARIKARAFHAAVAEKNGLRLPVLADDSGLEVDAMDGRPGVHSARYFKSAPQGNGWAAVLRELAKTPDQFRSARFIAVLVYIAPDGSEQAFEGICDGAINYAARGAGGFGYDPVFVPRNGQIDPPSGWLNQPSMAELAPREKHALSHRGLAAAKLCQWLRH